MRTHAQLGIHPTTGKLLVVGGMTPSGPATTMLMWDQNASAALPVNGPSPRYLPAVAYDPVRRVLALFGGGVGYRHEPVCRYVGIRRELK